jgi:hypothetical protein
MTNLVSFSLYGSHPKYIIGAMRNVILYREFLPSWKCVFFLGTSISEEIETELKSLGATTIRKAGTEDASGMFWRFEAIGIPGTKLVIFRDCDSRPIMREIEAITQWVESEKTLHIMRDHPMHNAKILGGMWGLNLTTPYFRQIDIPTLQKSEYGADQLFLAKHVYTSFRDDALIHDSFFIRENSAVRFPSSRFNGEYVGEVLDEFENYDRSLRKLLLEYESSRFKSTKLKMADIAYSLMHGN